VLLAAAGMGIDVRKRGLRFAVFRVSCFVFRLCGVWCVVCGVWCVACGVRRWSFLRASFIRSVLVRVVYVCTGRSYSTRFIPTRNATNCPTHGRSVPGTCTIRTEYVPIQPPTTTPSIRLFGVGSRNEIKYSFRRRNGSKR
jgi:hypothetical protein